MQESYNLLPFQANALDLVSDAVIAINNQNNIIYVNQAAIAQYGVERELATGQPLVTLFQCRWINPADEQSAERSLASTGRWKGENVHIKRDTQKIWVKSTVSVLKDEQNHQIGLLVVIKDITKHKQAEQERHQEAYREAERFFNLSLDMVIVADFQGYFRQVNPAVERTLGFTCEEFQGKHYMELVHPEDLETTRTAVENQEIGIAVIAFENRYRCKDGSYKWLSWTGVPFAEEGLIYAIAHDMSVRKQAEEAVRQSEEKFRQFAENSRDVFWMYDVRENQHIYISPAYERIWGQTCASLYANPDLFLDSIHPEDRERVRGAMAATAQGENQDLKYRIVRPNGEVRWIGDRCFPIRNQSGQIYRFAGIAEDITERKRAEEEQQKFVALVENSSDFIGMTSLEGEPFFINTAGRKLVGLDRFEQVHSAEMFFPTPETETCFREISFPTLMAPDRWESEGVFRHFKTGKLIDVYINAFIVRNPQNGEPLCRATITRDITERKQAEAKIKASLREKEILLQEIHHRVKNNLQVVTSLLDLQSQQVQDPETLKMFRQSQNRIRSIALIHEKLYESENIARVNLADYIYSLTTYLFQFYATKADNITLQTNIDEVSLNIDTAICCGLIINELISNALKYAFPNDRKGMIWVEVYHENYCCNLLIKNNGINLQEPIDLQKLKSLGLQLVKALVEQLKGQMVIEQIQGLAFRISFQL